jgi:hypothetical protein
LIDNSYDFLNDAYPNAGKEDRKIAASVKIDSKKPVSIIRIEVRNSNVNNFTVFANLHEIFDFNKWFSTKRYYHRVTAGALGDFLKRVLGMGYASWTGNDNPDDWFENKQWPEPVMLRFNREQHRVFVQVDRESSEIAPVFEEPTEYEAAADFTEVEIALPVSTQWKGVEDGLLHDLETYYRKQKLTLGKHHLPSRTR